MDINEIIRKVISELNKEVDLLLYPCREGITIPKYSNKGDACMDISSSENIIIKPNETIAIPTGLKMIIPEGYELQIKARSGISFNTPLRLSNSVGVIDCGFRDELKVLITNTSNNNENTYLLNEKGNKQGIYEIKKGDRIAQISLHKIINTNIKVIDEKTFTSNKDNRGGGLGSTGIN
ncbi:MAG: aminotransferase [Bacilli bacterium]|nr:aminotransferase [Bacilli bacterium]MDD4831798.1 aminotransferase [Bacilli bacterium]